MATKTKAKAITAGVQLLQHKSIHPSPQNRRVVVDAKLESLAQSIRESGIIQPIVVRPLADQDGEYEIVAGERRWLAAWVVGLTEIEAIVRTDVADDASAHSLRIIENLQREDVPPLEQASGVDALLKQYGSVEEVSKRLGVTECWVRVRANLTNLAQAWRKELAREDTEYEGIARYVTYQEELAKLPIVTQEHLLATRRLASVYSLEQLRSEIASATRRLEARPWSDQYEKSLVAKERCAKCKKRSDTKDSLFDIDEEDGALCLDPKCWGEKTVAYIIDCFRENAGKIDWKIATYTFSCALREALTAAGIEVLATWQYTSESEVEEDEILDGKIKVNAISLEAKSFGALVQIYIDDESESVEVENAGPERAARELPIEDRARILLEREQGRERSRLIALIDGDGEGETVPAESSVNGMFGVVGANPLTIGSELSECDTYLSWCNLGIDEKLFWGRVRQALRDCSWNLDLAFLRIAVEECGYETSPIDSVCEIDGELVAGHLDTTKKPPIFHPDAQFSNQEMEPVEVSESVTVIISE